MTILRVFVSLRAIAKELRRANKIAETRMRLEFGPDWETRGLSPRLSSISYPTARNWDERYDQLHPPRPE